MANIQGYSSSILESAKKLSQCTFKGLVQMVNANSVKNFLFMLHRQEKQSVNGA